MAAVEVVLGEHILPVVPQRHAYLVHRLGKFINGLSSTDQELTGENIAGFLGGHTYEALCVLIPALGKRMPEYEFQGYASKAAMDEQHYDPEQDKSPTFAEIVAAFDVAARVNRFDLVKHLWGLVDPTRLRRMIAVRMDQEVLKTSPSSPRVNGASPPTPSGTTVPT